MRDLLGCGDPSFTLGKTKHPTLLPENVCIIGARSFDSGEKELLERMKVKIFYMEEVKKRGFLEVFQEAVAYVNTHTQGYGISLDLDVIDPKEAPGVGTPESGGIVCTDVLKMITAISSDKALKAIEVVEYNPYRDRDERTACICLEILGRMIGHGRPKNEG